LEVKRREDLWPVRLSSYFAYEGQIHYHELDVEEELSCLHKSQTQLVFRFVISFHMLNTLFTGKESLRMTPGTYVCMLQDYPSKSAGQRYRMLIADKRGRRDHRGQQRNQCPAVPWNTITFGSLPQVWDGLSEHTFSCKATVD
jgi:hypothetical protein